MSWRYVQYETYWDIYPDDEYYDHDFRVLDRGDETKSDCKCNPTLKYEEGILFVIHNSFDEREGVELAKEISKRDIQ